MNKVDSSSSNFVFDDKRTQYTFNKKIPQNQAVGINLDLDNIVEKEAPINDLKKYLTNLAQDVFFKSEETQKSLQIYARSSGYELINAQMRDSICKDTDTTQHIKNIYSNLGTYGFPHPVRLFRTESSDYTQNVNGKDISSRKLSINDSWKFPSFISASVTNQPEHPKCQKGKLTVFVFEFKRNQDIKGLYLDQSVGMEGESEFLLSPAIAKVSDVYKLKIGMGYLVKKVKFVVCNLAFTQKVV